MFSFFYFIFILGRYELRSPKRHEHLWLCRLCHYVFIFFMYLRIRKSWWFFKMSLDERMYLSSHCSSQRTRHSCRHGGTVIKLCLDHPRVVIRLYPARNKLVQLLFICAVALCCSCISLIYKWIHWHIFRVFNEWPWIWSPRFAVRSFASSACLTSVRLLKRLWGLETCLTSDLRWLKYCNMLPNMLPNMLQHCNMDAKGAPCCRCCRCCRLLQCMWQYVISLHTMYCSTTESWNGFDVHAVLLVSGQEHFHVFERG